MSMIKRLYEKYREVIAYLFWGVAATVVSWGSYAIFVKGLNMSVFVGNLLSWVCAVAFAFVTNKVRVFKSLSWKADVLVRELGLFLSARVVTGIFEIVSVPLMVQFGLNQTFLGVKGALAKGIASVVVVILNYVFSKLWIFKDNK